jgi:hypothetical protein
VSLTRTQRTALAVLTATGRQWPLNGGRMGGDNYTTYCRYSRRTLQALVDAGHAEWVYTPGVMGHIVPAGTDQGTTSSSPGRPTTRPTTTKGN